MTKKFQKFVSVAVLLSACLVPQKGFCKDKIINQSEVQNVKKDEAQVGHEKTTKIRELINSYRQSLLIMTAYQVGIFNVVTTEPTSSEKLATKLNLEEDRIAPLLNALAFYDILSKNNNTYYLDYYKEVLNPNEEFNQLGYIPFAKDSMDKWNNLKNIIKNPEISTDNFNKMTNENASEFISAMHVKAVDQAEFLTKNYNFDNHQILDIGAGSGAYIIQAAKDYKNVKGKAIDLPEVAKILSENIKKEHLDSQLEVLSLDYNKQLPNEKYDDIFLFSVVHMENKNNVQKLLNNIHDSLKPNGKLFLTSYFLNEDKISPELPVLLNVQMLIDSTSGKIYTHNEITTHIKNAGFSKVSRVDEIPGQGTLYVAEK